MRIRALGLSLALLAGSAALPARANSVGPRVPCPAPKGVQLDAPLGVGESCPGVRPGARVQNPDGGFCTAGFLFSTGHAPSEGTADGSVFLSTAGHCLASDPLGGCGNTEQAWPAGRGPIEYAFDAHADAYPIGRWVYATHTCERDLAIIQLFAGVAYNAQVCHFHGPSRLDDGDPITGIVALHYFGQSTGPGNVAPARDALAEGVPNRGTNFALGLVSFGDSGSPLLTDSGEALGLVADLAGSVGANSAGNFAFARLNLPLERLRTQFGLRLRLVTAP